MSFLEALHWREATWLWLSLVPVGIAMISTVRQRQQWRYLADPELRPWLQHTAHRSVQQWSKMLLALAWLLFCIALAGPRSAAWIPPELRPVDQQWIAIIDFSASMRARDGHPDRVSSSAKLLHQWVKQMPEGNALGLITFAGHAHTLLPPSTDKALLQHFIQQLPQISPPTLGNNLVAAIHSAQEILQTSKQGRLLILSDGDLDTPNRQAIEAELQNHDTPIIWIAAGQDEHAIVPRANAQPMLHNGRPVTSRRHLEWLENIAKESPISAFNIESLSDDQIKAILAPQTASIPNGDEHRVLWEEYFVWPLLLGICLVVMALQINNQTHRKGLVALMSVLFLGACDGDLEPLTSAAKDETAIRQALMEENYPQVLALTQESNGYIAKFAQGIACYRSKDYLCAIQAFAAAAWLAEKPLDRGRAAFNLGLAHFRLADFEQAKVLFKDAELHGVDPEICQLNHAYASSLAEGVRKHLADIAESERRAAWRSAAGDLPEGFEDRLADDISLSRPAIIDQYLAQLDPASRQHLLQSSSAFSFSQQSGSATQGRSWVKTEQQSEPGNTASIMNSLMSIEAGLPMRPKEPLKLEGYRSW